MARKTISDETRKNIIIKSKRRCAYCFGLNGDISEKEGQIAHIDRNNENNSEENLAYLCLEHHNLYDSKYKQTVNYWPSELIHYKKELEDYIAKNFMRLDYNSQNINDTLPNSHDYKMFLKIREICLSKENLNRIINFNFGMSIPLNYFDIDENNPTGLGEYFCFLRENIDFYFRNKELEELFCEFLKYLCQAENRITSSYFYEGRSGYLYFNKNYNENIRDEIKEEFDYYIEKTRTAYIRFQNRAIELGFIS